MSRPGNDSKSYIVHVSPNGKFATVIGTHFAPGYTTSHKATQTQAINQQIVETMRQQQIETMKLHELQNLLASVEADESNS